MQAPERSGFTAALCCALAIDERRMTQTAVAGIDSPAAWWRLVLYGVLSLGVAVLSGVDLARTLRQRPRPHIKCDRYKVHLGTQSAPRPQRRRCGGPRCEQAPAR